jgi:hypothetical protein
MTATIAPGARIIVRTADDRRVGGRAITAVIDGLDFPVVWVCAENEWCAAKAEQREPEGIPWPAEDVEPADERDDNETAHRIVEEATSEADDASSN